jgi:hypothetical protein
MAGRRLRLLVNLDRQTCGALEFTWSAPDGYGSMRYRRVAFVAYTKESAKYLRLIPNDMTVMGDAYIHGHYISMHFDGARFVRTEELHPDTVRVPTTYTTPRRSVRRFTDKARNIAQRYRHK